MIQHVVVAEETDEDGTTMHRAVWNLGSGQLQITCNDAVLRDWAAPHSHDAVLIAIGSAYGGTAPTQSQLLEVLRYYLSK